MNASVEDLRPTITPNSSQLNSEQLLGGPMTVRISDVHYKAGEQQPVDIYFDGDNGRPYKPCLTMRKVLIFCWGADGREWVGKHLTLFNDQQVRFGGQEVGGIRISHMSHIERDVQVSLTATKGRKALHTIKRLDMPSGPALADVLQAIAAASTRDEMRAAKDLAGQLADSAALGQAVAAYNARAAELKAQKAKPVPEADPGVAALDSGARDE